MVIAAALVVALASAAESGLVVTLEGLGKIKGAALGSVREFHGVPFAAPPSGELRWRSPGAPAAWGGVRDAGAFHASCAQPSGFSPTITNTSEDCLFVDFYAPAAADGTSPVFVWIHGGGFTNGGANEARLNGSAAILALEAAGVSPLPVVAVLQYRLGVFGFAGSSELRDPETNATGNWGFEDQVAALAFVKAHAAAFGGDATSMTIAGQSAGGASVGNHLVSPKSRGLFQRAIGMSGSFSDWAAVALDSQEAAFGDLKAAAGCADVACLRGLDADALLSAYGGVQCGACFEATVDGVMLSDYPNELMEADGLPDGVAFLAGCTRDEANTFDAGGGLGSSAGAKQLKSWVQSEYALSAQDASTLLSDNYPASSYDDRGGASKSYLRGVAAETDQSIRCALRRGAAKAKNAKAYVYSFDRGVGGTNFANHADDIPFVFSATAALDQAGANDDDKALAAKMTRAFFAFARTGDPNDGNDDFLPAWAPFTGETSDVMHFDATLTVDAYPAVQAGCTYWKDHHYYGKQS